MADEIQQQQQEHAELQQEQLQQQAEQPEQLAQQTEQTQQTQQQENLDQVEQQQQPDEQLGDQDMDHQEESNEQEESDDQDMDQETQAHVQQQRQRELDKLHAIDAKVRQVHERLTSRLPRQRAHLSAKVCGVVWAVRASAATAAAAAMQSSEERGAVTTSTTSTTTSTTTTTTTDSLAKKLRLELGAFDYQVREQGELLTRYLCDLDDVLSFGDAAIKDARKALVVFIQSEALPLADALREQSAKLRAFGERLISTLPVESSAVPPPSPSPSPSESQSQSQATQSDSPMKVPSQSTVASGSDAVDSDVDVDMHPLFGTDDEEDASDDNNDVVDDDDGVSDEDVESGVDDSEDEEMANEDDDREEEHNSIEEEQAPAATSTPAAVDTRSLPVWKPYYQIHKRRDALYLVANLRDVDPQNVRVQWLERADGGGVLHISGVKLPTQRDVLVSRFSGVPTFGRFEIAERVPSASTVDMSRASQTLREDGTLEVRMPYAYSGSSSSSSRTAGIPCSISSDYPRYSVSGYPYSPRSYPYPHPHDYHRRQQQQQQQQPQYHQELHHPMHPLQQYYQQQQGYPRSAFRRRVSPWFDAPRCVVW